MGRTVQELQAVMTAKEFAEWKAFDKLEPFGDERADIRAAVLGALVIKAAGGSSTELLDLVPTLMASEFIPVLRAKDDPRLRAVIKRTQRDAKVENVLAHFRSTKST